MNKTITKDEIEKQAMVNLIYYIMGEYNIQIEDIVIRIISEETGNNAGH